MKSKRVFVGLAIALLLQHCTFSSNNVSPLAGDWMVRSEFEGVARSAAVGFTIGDMAYIGTGIESHNQLLKDFWKYDPIQNTWTRIANFAGEARSGAVAFAIGPKGYLGTGNSINADPLRDFYEYNSATNTWKRISDFGGSARHSAVGFSTGSKGFVGTGFADKELRDFWAYDPVNDTWIRKADFGGPARAGAITFSVNNAVYVGTGSVSGTLLDDLWIYDSSADLWSRRQSIPTMAYSTTTGTAFAIGNTGYFVSKLVWAFDPATNSWSQKAPFEGASRTRAVGFGLGSRGYITTGSSGTACFSDLWAFDPAM